MWQVLALTPQVRACVLVAVGLESISKDANSNVAEQGIGSRGHALAMALSYCDFWL
jgi:hypothetical protein